MRPIQITYAPITANATAFNAQTFTSTGAATAVTTPATADGLAHLVTLVAAVQSTLAGVTFTILGTDANGMVLTETGLVGPASGATVTSTKHFKTIVTITPSATMGGLVVSVGIAAESVMPMIPLEWRSITPAAMTVQLAGVANFSVEETYGSPYNNKMEDLPWVAITALTGKSATTSGQATSGTQAVRLKTNTVTNGATLTFYITQSSGQVL
jgi:hypothetical protein